MLSIVVYFVISKSERYSIGGVSMSLKWGWES